MIPLLFDDIYIHIFLFILSLTVVIILGLKIANNDLLALSKHKYWNRNSRHALSYNCIKGKAWTFHEAM